MHLILFFTRGISLQTWSDNGSLEREIALYLRLQKMGMRVSFISYGGKTDLKYRSELQGIEILCNRWNLPVRIYEYLIPWLHARALSHASVLKTNQTSGAEIALRAAQVWHKPLVARCGYMWSEFAASGAWEGELEQAKQVEKSVFSNAKRVVVTTQEMKDYAIKQYALLPGHVQVIPNYVMTDIFVTGAEKPQANRICFIGRLDEQKNLPALIKACAGMEVELVLIGEGPQRSSLQELAKQLGVNVSLPGIMRHHQLPDIINRSAIFTLVSTIEGHPKALLEAMSCGAAVLGANSPGIREQIIHGETGWLCGTDVESIRAGIQHLLEDPQLRHRLGANARRFIVGNYSLDKVVELEYSLLNEIAV